MAYYPTVIEPVYTWGIDDECEQISYTIKYRTFMKKLVGNDLHKLYKNVDDDSAYSVLRDITILEELPKEVDKIRAKRRDDTWRYLLRNTNLPTDLFPTIISYVYGGKHLPSQIL